MNRRIVFVALALAATGCKKKNAHLQYDFGRSYMTAFQLQADLTRASVRGEQYDLGGLEGEKIRLLAEQAATKAKENATESNAK